MMLKSHNGKLVTILFGKDFRTSFEKFAGAIRFKEVVRLLD